ncbi:MAG: collagen-like protein [Deltaproteobacteria bacterium]|nr:collagen-like protein [Deltaproteobacteria bacterium]MCW5808103.1 collagen-like protein [Deltaproteobacteria bacterium]
MLRAAVTVSFVASVSCVPDRGDVGPAGQKGEMGEQGEMGAMGEMGNPGPPGTAGQQVREVLGTAQVQVSAASTSFVLVPGLAATVDVPAGTTQLVQTEGGIQCTELGNAFGAVDLALFVDGQPTNTIRRIVAANSVGLAQMIATWSFGRTFQLAPGTHTFDVRVMAGAPAMAVTNVSSAAAPQLQGVLRVTTLKQ